MIIPANFLQTVAKRDFYLPKIKNGTRSDMRETYYVSHDALVYWYALNSFRKYW